MARKVVRTNRRRWRRDVTRGWLVVNGTRCGRPQDGQAQSGGRGGMGRASGRCGWWGPNSGRLLGVDRRLLRARRLSGGGTDLQAQLGTSMSEFVF